MAERTGPGLCGQAFRLLLAAAALAVVGDLVHPNGVLRHRAATLRDMDLLPVVFAWPAEQVAAALAAGDVEVVDVRADADWSAGHAAGSRRGHPDDSRLVDQATELELLARDVVVVAGRDHPDRARDAAQKLILEYGALRAITVVGGFEALRDAGVPLEDGP